MADFKLDAGFTLPEIEQSKEIPNQEATQLAAQFVAASNGITEDATQLIEEKKSLISRGEYRAQREAATLQAQQSRSSGIAESANEALQQGKDAFTVLEKFKLQAEAIQRIEVEQAAVEAFSGVDPVQSKILARNKDAVQLDHVKLANSIAMYNMSIDWNSRADSFIENIADVPEAILGGAIDEVMTFGSKRKLFEEVQEDMGKLNTTAFVAKWEEKLNELNEDLFFDNNDRTASLARILAGGDKYAAMSSDSVLGLEAVLSPLGLGLTKAPLTVANAIRSRSFLGATAVESGGSKAVADDIATSIRTKTEGTGMLSDEEQIAYAIAGRTSDEYLDQLPMEAIKTLQRNDRILTQLDELPIEAVSDAITMKAMRDKFLEKFEANYSQGSVANVVYSHDKAGILNGMMARIGSEQGHPFASKELAREYLSQQGVKGTIVLDKATGGFYGQVNVPLKGDITPAINSYKKVGVFKSLFFTPNEFLDQNYLALSRGADATITRIHDVLKDGYNSTVGKLNAKSKLNVARVMEGVARSENPRWLSPDDFITEFKAINDGVLPTNGEVLAYMGMRQLEDGAYRMLNKATYRAKKQDGYSTIRYSGTSAKLGEAFNGKVATVDEIPKSALIFDESTDSLRQLDTNFAGSMSRASLAKKLESNTLIKIDPDTGLGGGAQYALVPSNTIKTEALNLKQVGYIGGGRIFYDYNWIIHASRKRTMPQFGDLVVHKNPVALFGGKTRKETIEFMDKLKEGQKIALAVKSGAIALDEGNVLLQALSIPKLQDVDTLKSFLSTRGVELSDDIVMASDGEIPRTAGGGFRAATDGERIMQPIKNRLSRSRTDNRLGDVRGGFGFLDPFESMEKSIGAASRHAAFSDYRAKAVNMFMKAYGDKMKITPGEGVNPLEVLESGIDPNKVKTLGVKDIAAISSHRQQLLQTVKFRSKTERAWELAANNLSDFFLEKGFKKTADKLADSRAANPIGKWKSLAFNARMGLFALPQFVLQASMAPSIMAMSPKFGLAAMADYFPLRAALIAKDPAMIEHLATSLNKGRLWAKEDSGDFIDYVNTFKALGISDFGASIPEIAGRTGGLASDFGGKLLTSGKVFFREGELVPRATAYGIAVRKFRANSDGVNPQNLKITSEEGKKFILTETNRLTFGITGADIQLGLRGLASVPTQFWSYPVRMTAALFGKQFSTKEKAMFYGSMATLYGAGGVPLADQVIEWYAKKYQVDLSEEQAKLLYNGVVDSAILSMSDGELNVDFSSRQLGSFWPEVYKTFVENPVLTTVAGPTGKSMSRGWEALSSGLKPVMLARTASIEQVTDVALKTLATQVTSVDRVYRGWLAWNTGVLRDMKGRKQIALSHDEILAWAGGLPIQEFNDTFNKLDDLTAQRDFIKENANELFQIQQRWFSDPKNSTIYESQIQAIALMAQRKGNLDEVLTLNATLLRDSNFTEEIAMKYLRNIANGNKLNKSLAGITEGKE